MHGDFCVSNFMALSSRDGNGSVGHGSRVTASDVTHDIEITAQ